MIATRLRWAWLTALALAVATPVLANAPTGAQCEDAWNDSSARDSCGLRYYANGHVLVDTNRYYVSASGGGCKVKVDCRQHNQQHPPIANEFLGTIAEVESLNNCAGNLKKGNC